MLCTLAFSWGILNATAQSSNATPSSATDPAITPLSVMGVVTNINPDTRQVLVTTNAGSQVAVTLSETTEFMRTVLLW